MNKFIGQMTYEDFIDALKIILKTKIEYPEEKKPEDTRTLKEKFFDGIASVKAFCNYIITLKFIKDFWTKAKEFFTEDKEDDKEKTELTKEKFIEEGLKVKAAVKEIVETVVFVIVMVIIIRFFIGEIRWIPSGSMHPTLLEGDRIFVERYSRFYKTPDRGDIMVFYPPSENLPNTPWRVFSRLTGIFCKDIAYIKRVVGMPGEKFEIKTDKFGKSTVYINDEPLDEPYIQSSYDFSTCLPEMFCGPFVIPEKHYVMLGDNRGNSQDSRYWGMLTEDRFIGRAIFLFWPVKRTKSLIFKGE